MTDRQTASTINDAQLDELYAELTALRQVARGYCPACGRGDAAPTVTDWEQQKQRADQLAATLREVLDAFEVYWARASYDGPSYGAVQPEHLQAWRAALKQHAPAATEATQATKEQQP